MHINEAGRCKTYRKVWEMAYLKYGGSVRPSSLSSGSVEKLSFAIMGTTAETVGPDICENALVKGCLCHRQESGGRDTVQGTPLHSNVVVGPSAMILK